MSCTLCWTCRNAAPCRAAGRGCEWSREFKPVPGWKARRQKRAVLGETYTVYACPKYLPDRLEREARDD